MPDYWFTADPHFGHASILQHQQATRPFDSLDAMNSAIVFRWNERVKPGDVVYCLGDFAWKPDVAAWALDNLNGQINLIRGNHDGALKSPKIAKRFGMVKDLHEIRIGQQKIVLCHYAMRVWNCSHYGAWQLYGHSHGSLPDDPHALSMDVGLDTHGLRPYSLAEVAQRMVGKSWVPVDHHAPRTEGGGNG